MIKKEKTNNYIGYYSTEHSIDNGAAFYRNTRSGYPELVSFIQREDVADPIPPGLKKLGPVGDYLKSYKSFFSRPNDPRNT